MAIETHGRTEFGLVDDESQALPIDDFLDKNLRTRMKIDAQSSSPADFGDGVVVYADGTTLDREGTSLPGLIIGVGEDVHVIAHAEPAANIPDVTGETDETDVEARAAIALILDILLASGLMLPPEE